MNEKYVSTVYMNQISFASLLFSMHYCVALKLLFVRFASKTYGYR